MPFERRLAMPLALPNLFCIKALRGEGGGAGGWGVY